MYWLANYLYKKYRHKSLAEVRAAGRRWGRIMYHILRDRRAVAEINARIIGVSDPVAVARASFEHTFQAYFEIFFIENIDDDFVQNSVTVSGEDHFQALRESGQPFFFSSAHVGCWDIGASIIARRFRQPMGVVARRITNPKIDEMLVRLRSYHDITFIHHRNAAGKIMELTTAGVPVGTLLDHNATMKDSILVPLFGIKTPFIAGVPAMAARKHFPIIPLFGLRTEQGVHIEFHPPIWPDQNLKPKERIYGIAKALNERFEDVIRRNPEQWYLIHKRFKKIEEEDGTFVENFYEREKKKRR